MTGSYPRAGTKPTAREIEVARAILACDSMSAAAASLGMHEVTLRRHVARMRVRLRARNTPELFFRLRDHLAA